MFQPISSSNVRKPYKEHDNKRADGPHSLFIFIMGINPTDLSEDFVKSGKRLITQVSSDALLKKANKKQEECLTEYWDPTLGPQDPPENCK